MQILGKYLGLEKELVKMETVYYIVGVLWDIHHHRNIDQPSDKLVEEMAEFGNPSNLEYSKLVDISQELDFWALAILETSVQLLLFDKTFQFECLGYAVPNLEQP